jgi:hypothetical protein
MSNIYRARTRAAEAAYGEGVFEHEFDSPAAERDALGSLLEIVPRKYRVLSDNYERAQGEEFEGTFLMEIEAALIQGGHLERVAEPAPDEPAEGEDSKSSKRRAKKAADEQEAE